MKVVVAVDPFTPGTLRNDTTAVLFNNVDESCKCLSAKKVYLIDFFELGHSFTSCLWTEHNSENVALNKVKRH